MSTKPLKIQTQLAVLNAVICVTQHIYTVSTVVYNNSVSACSGIAEMTEALLTTAPTEPESIQLDIVTEDEYEFVDLQVIVEPTTVYVFHQ
jgi:hypothetical protein